MYYYGFLLFLYSMQKKIPPYYHILNQNSPTVFSHPFAISIHFQNLNSTNRFLFHLLFLKENIVQSPIKN
jgi:hypothetical protein